MEPEAICLQFEALATVRSSLEWTTWVILEGGVAEFQSLMTLSQEDERQNLHCCKIGDRIEMRVPLHDLSWLSPPRLHICILFLLKFLVNEAPVSRLWREEIFLSPVGLCLLTNLHVGGPSVMSLEVHFVLKLVFWLHFRYVAELNIVMTPIFLFSHSIFLKLWPSACQHWNMPFLFLKQEHQLFVYIIFL